jgi:hypothetical protein
MPVNLITRLGENATAMSIAVFQDAPVTVPKGFRTEACGAPGTVDESSAQEVFSGEEVLDDDQEHLCRWRSCNRHG